MGCRGCGQLYPVACGIPDLRVFSDPYIDSEADRTKGKKVAEQFDHLDFEALIDYYYSITEVVPARHAHRYKRSLLSAVPRAESALVAWEAASATDGKGKASRRLLEIGCGTGPALVAASHHYSSLVGIDIAFRWLVVGKKHLAEAGLDVPLICACAEALPFPDDSFDCVVADSVLEHTRSPADSLKESRRVTQNGGRLFVSTPNRFSIGPDPHTGLPAGGVLPQKLTAYYVRRLGGIPPKRQLLSAVSVGKLFKRCGYTRPNIFLPDVPQEQRALFPPTTQKLVDLYHVFKRLPACRHFLYLFGPLLYAVAKPAAVVSGQHDGHGGGGLE